MQEITRNHPDISDFTNVMSNFFGRMSYHFQLGVEWSFQSGYSVNIDTKCHYRHQGLMVVKYGFNPSNDGKVWIQDLEVANHDFET